MCVEDDATMMAVSASTVPSLPYAIGKPVPPIAKMPAARGR